MVCPKLRAAFEKSQIIFFLVLVHLYMMISAGLKAFFKIYISFKDIKQQPVNEHCCNMLLQQNNLFRGIA